MDKRPSPREAESSVPADIALESLNHHCQVISVKTVSKHQAAVSLETLGDLVHSGETVLVVHGGKPWFKMVPAKAPIRRKTATDFKARLSRISPKSVPGVTKILKRTRE